MNCIYGVSELPGKRFGAEKKRARRGSEDVREDGMGKYTSQGIIFRQERMIIF